MIDSDNTSSGAGSVAAPQQGAAPLTVFAAPATGSEFNTLGERLVPKGCFKIEDLLFDFDSSFVLPDIETHLPKLVQLRNDNNAQDSSGADILPPLSIFGHADPVGDDDFNKRLSGRRATAIYAMLVRDVDLWEQLFTNPVGGDDWGTRAVQTMLSRVQEPIAIDGVSGDETQTAVRDFQSAQGLAADGVAGPDTRKALYRAYMDALCGVNLALDKSTDFLARNQDGPGGKGDRQGCSEFNPLLVFSQDKAAGFAAASDKTERNTANAPNRRVMVLLFAPGRRVNPTVWPCPRVSEGVADCKKRFFPDAEVRRGPQAQQRNFEDTKNTFACRFYQIISDDSPCERLKPIPLVLRVFLLDKLGRRVPAGTPYRITAGGQVRTGKIGEPGLLVEPGLTLDQNGTIEWTRLVPAKQTPDAEERLLARKQVAAVEPEAAGHSDLFLFRARGVRATNHDDAQSEELVKIRLHNMAYPRRLDVADKLVIFKNDYEFQADQEEARKIRLRDVHRDGEEMPLEELADPPAVPAEIGEDGLPVRQCEKEGEDG